MLSVSRAHVWPRNRVKYLLKVVLADPGNRFLNLLNFLREFNRFRLSNAELRVLSFHKGHCFVDLVGAWVRVICLLRSYRQVSQILLNWFIELEFASYSCQHEFFLYN